jgi:3-oxoadipate enol-lactonase
MSTAIAMPRLGMTMTEGTVLTWPVPLGGRVEKGQVVLTIESEKAEVEIEAPASGVLRHVYVEPERTVPCGTLLAALTDTAEEPFDAEEFRRRHERAAPAGRTPGEGPVSAPAAPAPRAVAGRVPLTPAARRRARDLGVEPEEVPGSGPGGRVTVEDVESWAARRRTLVEVAPAVRLEVPAQGQGDPVLLLPGFGVDVSSFARQIPALAERYRVHGVNPRGIGLSDAPEAERYDVAVCAADAAAVAPSPAHVIGASLGAAVAIELALGHRERVRSLTLITPFARAGARLLAVVDVWCRLAAEAGSATLAAALAPWLFSASLLADDGARRRLVRGLAQTVARASVQALARHAAGLRAWSGTRGGALSAISAPTLVISAGEDLLVADAAAVAAAIPAARHVAVRGAGHAVALEAPDQVGSSILEHLTAAT